MSANESQIEKDIALILEHQSISLSEKDNSIYKVYEELERLSRETFYSHIKTEKGWRNLFIILGFVILSLEVWGCLPNATNIFASIIIVAHISLMLIYLLLIFIYRIFAKNSKISFTEFGPIIRSALGAFLSSLILGVSYNSMQLKLCSLIYEKGSQYHKGLMWVFILTASIVSFIIIIFLVKKLLSSFHKKWYFLSTKNLIINAISPISLLIISPVLKIFESLDKQNIGIERDYLLLADLHCIIGVLLFISSTVLTQNFSVTKKYKAKYKSLLEYAKDKHC